MSSPLRAADPVDIGSRLELLVDDELIKHKKGAVQLRLNHPVPREVVMVRDRPWEGNESLYTTIFKDGPIYRMYYRGRQVDYTSERARQHPEGIDRPHPDTFCYAESPDGVRWKRPELGLFEFDGSKQNNIVWDGKPLRSAGSFSVFKDTNPDCPPGARYKAVTSGATPDGGVWTLQSPDGIHWTLLSDKAVISGNVYASQTVAFWDSNAGYYRAYVRDFRNVPHGRDIRTAVSSNFVDWTEPAYLKFLTSRAGELYTSQVLPYHRAPHYTLGFPTRYINRGWTDSARRLPQLQWRRTRGTASMREGTALTDTMFMSSRDGWRFRIRAESFIRPGPQRDGNWFYGDHLQNWGLVETSSNMAGAADELSIYLSESTLQGKSCALRRYTMRIDGFVSAHAPFTGGELITKPIRFNGNRLLLNLATSVVGSVRVEIQDPQAEPIPGFTLGDSEAIYGDEIARPATWRGNPDVSALAGKAVRLRFELKDADLYAYQFKWIQTR